MNDEQKHAFIRQQMRDAPEEMTIHRAIFIFSLATFPAYLSLLSFGYSAERLELPIICAGIAAVLLIWAITALDQNSWSKEYERRFNLHFPPSKEKAE